MVQELDRVFYLKSQSLLARGYCDIRSLGVTGSSSIEPQKGQNLQSANNKEIAAGTALDLQLS